MTVHDDIWLTYELHWRERFGWRGDGLESMEDQNTPRHKAQCEGLVACVATGGQMFTRHDTTDVHSCSLS